MTDRKTDGSYRKTDRQAHRLQTVTDRWMKIETDETIPNYRQRETER